MKGSLQCKEEWNDVHQNNSLALDVNNDLESVRERLHVIDENGKTRIGFEAFLVIWHNSKSRSDRAKSWFFGLPVLRQISNVIYNVLARVLYNWNRWKKHW